MTTNEAAERLSGFPETADELLDLLDQPRPASPDDPAMPHNVKAEIARRVIPRLLAAERRATVERIRKALNEADEHPGFSASPDYYSGLQVAQAILDEEAAR